MGLKRNTRAVLCGFAICILALAPGRLATAGPDSTGAPDSGTAAAVQGKPQIRFTRLEHDFGKTISGPDLKATFEFKNVGDDVLVIQKVKGG